MSGSQLAGLLASKATAAGNVSLDGVQCAGPISFVGTRIEGALILDRAGIHTDAAALDATRMFVGQDLRAQFGFSSSGEIILDDAEISGSLFLEGAKISSESGRALTARGLAVGAVVHCCTGFTAAGKVSFTSAQIRSHVCFNGAHLSTSEGTALSCRHLITDHLILTPASKIGGKP